MGLGVRAKIVLFWWSLNSRNINFTLHIVPSSTLSDEELLAKLRAKYDRTTPGHCPTCGAAVTVEDHAGGYPLPWSCPAGLLAWQEAQGQETSEAQRQAALAHWQSSRWEDYRRVGDRRVMELIERYERLLRLGQ